MQVLGIPDLKLLPVAQELYPSPIVVLRLVKLSGKLFKVLQSIEGGLESVSDSTNTALNMPV
jgi:hypothetical protein